LSPLALSDALVYAGDIWRLAVVATSKPASMPEPSARPADMAVPHDHAATRLPGTHEPPLPVMTAARRNALLSALGGPIMATPERLVQAMAKAGEPLFGAAELGDMTMAQRSWVAALCQKYAAVEADLLAQGAV
jgi:hypothetical protein